MCSKAKLLARKNVRMHLPAAENHMSKARLQPSRQEMQCLNICKAAPCNLTTIAMISAFHAPPTNAVLSICIESAHFIALQICNYRMHMHAKIKELHNHTADFDLVQEFVSGPTLSSARKQECCLPEKHAILVWYLPTRQLRTYTLTHTRISVLWEQFWIFGWRVLPLPIIWTNSSL